MSAEAPDPKLGLSINVVKELPNNEFSSLHSAAVRFGRFQLAVNKYY